MREDKDDRIVELLRADAPPPRDPMFRVGVLERREHWQFQRRLCTMLAGALAIILVSVFAIGMGTGAMGSMGVLAVGAALASGYLAFRRSLPHILRRFGI